MLINIGLIDKKIRGMPSKRYFKIIQNVNLIDKLLAEGEYCSLIGKKGTSIKEHIDFMEIPKLHTNKKHLIRKKNNKKINGLFLQSCAHNIDFIDSIINHYLDSYEKYMGKEHPVLKDKYWHRVIKSINEFTDDHLITESSDFCLMIDAYFKQNINCDRNILHFATEGIMGNRAYEAGIY